MMVVFYDDDIVDGLVMVVCGGDCVVLLWVIILVELICFDYCE